MSASDSSSFLVDSEHNSSDYSDEPQETLDLLGGWTGAPHPLDGYHTSDDFSDPYDNLWPHSSSDERPQPPPYTGPTPVGSKLNVPVPRTLFKGYSLYSLLHARRVRGPASSRVPTYLIKDKYASVDLWQRRYLQDPQCYPKYYPLDGQRPTSYGRESYISAIGAARCVVDSLAFRTALVAHTGCVNSVNWDESGSTLVSGGDDLSLKVWDINNMKYSRNSLYGQLRLCDQPVATWDSGHRSNIFGTVVVPFTNSRLIVSCSRDGQVRLSTRLTNGEVETKQLALHHQDAHRVVLDPHQPSVVLSCSADGRVLQMDLREGGTSTWLYHAERIRNKRQGPSTTTARSSFVLTKPMSKLVGIDVHPADSHTVAVCGSDPAGVAFLDRRIGGDDCAYRQLPNCHTDMTGIRYNYNGSKILVSYSAYDSMNRYNTPGGWRRPNTIDSTILQYDLDRSDLVLRKYTSGSFPKEEDAPPIRGFTGHLNLLTLKQVNYYGLNSQYVISGSDNGSVYMWDTNTTRRVHTFAGDTHVVNCVMPHPRGLPLIATSGIDNEVKLIVPSQHPLLSDSDDDDSDDSHEFSGDF